MLPTRYELHLGRNFKRAVNYPQTFIISMYPQVVLWLFMVNSAWYSEDILVFNYLSHCWFPVKHTAPNAVCLAFEFASSSNEGAASYKVPINTLAVCRIIIQTLKFSHPYQLYRPCKLNFPLGLKQINDIISVLSRYLYKL